jgi:hypothetical protein
MFHVKRFGTIGGMGKCTRTKRRGIQSWDLGQAQDRDKNHEHGQALVEPVSKASTSSFETAASRPPQDEGFKG